MHFDSLRLPESELAWLENDAALDVPETLDPQLVALTTEEIVRRGYRLSITDGPTVRCRVRKDGRTQFSVWGLDSEDALRQVAMRILLESPLESAARPPARAHRRARRAHAHRARETRRHRERDA